MWYEPLATAVTVRQLPDSHFFVEQAFPHAPQFWPSVRRLAQVEVQFVVPLGHEQLLDTQLPPVGHTLPHAPQFDESAVRFTHEPPQAAVPPTQ